MPEWAVATPVALRRLDADALPLWLCLSGLATGLSLVLAAVLDGADSHGAMTPGHMHTHHVHHLVMIVGTTLIMMSTFAFPLLRTVARTTLWMEAVMAVAAAWVGFIGLWCVAAIGMHVAGELLASVLTQQGAIVVLAGLCVVAQLTRRRAAMLNACQRTRPMRPHRPVGGGLSWSADAAYRCIKVCAAPMTLMALSPTLAVSTVIAALVWWERFSSRRREHRPPLMLGYLVIGAGMLLEVAIER